MDVFSYEVLDLSNFDLEDRNMIDMTAKRGPEAFTEFKGELVKGEEIHKKTGLTLNDIDLVVEVLEKSLVIEIPNVFQRLPPYNFLRYRNN